LGRKLPVLRHCEDAEIAGQPLTFALLEAQRLAHQFSCAAPKSLSRLHFTARSAGPPRPFRFALQHKNIAGGHKIITGELSELY
jgi:hypothetical protein